MVKILKGKFGFTLLEMILVLFALSLSLILAIPYAKGASIHYESKVMMRNVMQHFEYVHKMAMVKNDISFVTFSKNEVTFQKALLKDSPGDITFVFPEETSFMKTSQFSLLGSGNVDSQTLTLVTPTKNYHIVFQFSGGRYVFEES